MQSKIFWILIILIGSILLIYTGFNYATTEELIALGPVKISKEKNHFIQFSPILGALLIVGGSIMLVRNSLVRS